MKENLYLSDILQNISSERLNPYLSFTGQREVEALGLYSWNIAICESLYPSLNQFEVALRNSMHRAASQKFGRAEWLFSQLHREEFEPMERTYRRLSSERQNAGVGDLIANLTLGFWLTLFRSRYEQTLWPELLEPIFPHCPRSQRTRRHVYARLEMIRRLRNRVFHHEPVWHLRDLEEQHQRILETIGWISPAMLEMTRLIDRFDSVYTRGADHYATELDSVAQSWNA